MGGGNSRLCDPQNLSGRVAVVTGASDGIGYETAKALASMGARTILACRNEEKTLEAMVRMREELGRAEDELKLEFLHLDLASFSSTKQFVASFKQKDCPLHILINNAGIGFVPFGKTDDGFERHFQVNHLSHFLLTLELLPALRRGSQERGEARVVIVSSASHTSAVFNPANMNGEQSYSRYTFYGNSKLYNMMFGYSLQRRVKDDNITVSCVHPGAIKTNIVEEPSTGSRVLRAIGTAIVNLPMFKSPDWGARQSINCAVDPELHPCTMIYYDKGTATLPSDLSRDVRCQKQLWEISIRSVQEHLSSETLQNYNGVTAEDEELKKGKQQSTPPEPQQPEASTQEGSGGEKG